MIAVNLMTTSMMTPTENVDAAVTNTIMPDNWMFPGFIVFSMFGPIVETEMRYYQSHLLMPKPKDGTAPNGTNSGTRLMTSDNNNNKKRHKVQLKVEPGSLDHSSLRNKLIVSQEFQKAAMEQSKLLLQSHEDNQYNDGLVSMYTTKVAGLKV